MELEKYLSEEVSLTDIDNEQWRGKVETYTPAIDSEYDEDEIGLSTKDGLIGFRQSEIKAISVN